MEFHFLQTEDGSPSLKLGLDAEGMHNAKGAFSETVYIYGTAIDQALESQFVPSFFSLGLGLGYNELLATGLCLKHQINLKEVYGESFESVTKLSENFLNWLFERPLEPEFRTAYDKIVDLSAKHTQQKSSHIKQTFKALIESHQWHLREALTPQTKFEQHFSCFLFDAFSSKTSPELWSEDFISDLLKSSAKDHAILSTYACTGSLKRALLKSSFKVQIRCGFAGKRESIFAIRN